MPCRDLRAPSGKCRNQSGRERTIYDVWALIYVSYCRGRLADSSRWLSRIPNICVIQQTYCHSFTYKSSGRRKPMHGSSHSGSRAVQLGNAPPSPVKPKCRAGPKPMRAKSSSKSSGRIFSVAALSLKLLSSLFAFLYESHDWGSRTRVPPGRRRVCARWKKR